DNDLGSDHHNGGSSRVGARSRDRLPTASTRAWADEDIDIHSCENGPGHQIEITLESQPNVIPVPLLEELLTTVDFRSFERLPDSFGADLGLRYLELQFVSELFSDSNEATRGIYEIGLAGTPYQMGNADIINEGMIRVTVGWARPGPVRQSSASTRRPSSTRLIS
ncbi:MAG: hypothetical protein VX525_04425, partial [Actinomycetota bacterium]|nr:hypothetical protein [Actinomycetota bacterium]